MVLDGWPPLAMGLNIFHRLWKITRIKMHLNVSLVNLFTVYLKCSDSSSAAVLEHYTDLIQNLASGEKILILTDSQPPEGCAISTVSARCEVHMMLKVSVAVYICMSGKPCALHSNAIRKHMEPMIFGFWVQQNYAISVQGTVDLWSYILPIDRYSHTL